MDFPNKLIKYIGFITFLFNNLYKTRSGRLAIDSYILDIPLFGDLILKSEVASLSDTLSTLIVITDFKRFII